MRQRSTTTTIYQNKGADGLGEDNDMRDVRVDMVGWEFEERVEDALAKVYAEQFDDGRQDDSGFRRPTEPVALHSFTNQPQGVDHHCQDLKVASYQRQR